MEEFLRKLGINEIPEKSEDGTYVIDINNSNEFAKYYSKLEKSTLLDEDEDSSQITADVISVQYISDMYLVTILGDLEQDKYSLTIKQI